MVVGGGGGGRGCVNFQKAWTHMLETGQQPSVLSSSNQAVLVHQRLKLADDLQTQPIALGLVSLQNLDTCKGCNEDPSLSIET